MNQPFIHALADIQTAQIGAGTRVWQFVVLPDAKIGQDKNICSHFLIENDVVLGDRVMVKSGMQLWNGLHIANAVFIGPNITCTNDKFPRSKMYSEGFGQTIVMTGPSIGGEGDIAKHNDWCIRRGGCWGRRHAIRVRGGHRRGQPNMHRRV